MGKLNTKQSEVFASISAINTLLERYPTLTITDPMLTNFSMNTSVGFLLSLLELFGVSQADLINWICKLLGDGENGFLDVIEHTVKGILMANVKAIFTCSIDPILPDNIMKYAVVDGGTQRVDPSARIPYDLNKKNCIEINLTQIDLFGLLANCPSNDKGGVFYFDAFDPATVEQVVVDSATTIDIYSPHYIPSELYKSRDFNAFLWYVINKGNIGSPTDLQKNTWDNRNKVYKKYEGNDILKNAFFAPVSGLTNESKPKIPIPNENNKVLDKEQYIICQYSENEQTYSNTLKVWLNADRYYRTRKVKIPSLSGGTTEIAMNRTIYEFNYDYIYSLKLFDTKTLVASIVNSLLGLSSSISASFSFEQKQMQKKVENIIKKMIAEEETQVSDDCYYKFSNSIYQQMIDEVTKEYNGSYTDPASSYSKSFDDVYDALRNLDVQAEKAGQSELLQKVLEVTFSQMANSNSNGITGGLEYNTNMRLSVDFITDFLTQTITQIVLQILSPKVAILFAINSEILNSDVTNIEEWKTVASGWEAFIKDFNNYIRNIASAVKDILIKELYNFVMEQLKPLLELFVAKLALETVRDYRELIISLIKNCIPMFALGRAGLNTEIDNVNYADIIANIDADTPQVKPKQEC